MDFGLTEEQRMIRDTLREFARERLVPGAAQRDRDHAFPADLLQELAALGAWGMVVISLLAPTWAELAYCRIFPVSTWSFFSSSAMESKVELAPSMRRIASMATDGRVGRVSRAKERANRFSGMGIGTGVKE